ncbi:MAG: hypothetical protein JWL90_3909 [Chthoniobacteraceae bacterium]|nr:hypothetical protein [Chthoniobacteraceae bacterium]
MATIAVYSAVNRLKRRSAARGFTVEFMKDKEDSPRSSVAEVQCRMNKPDQDRHFEEQADHGGEERDGHGDGQFKVVTGRDK